MPSDMYDAMRALVDEQAEDEGLWFIAQTAPEAYLQQELRRLHAAVEAAGDIPSEDGRKTPPPAAPRTGVLGEIIEPPAIEPGRICGRCGYNPCQCHLGTDYSLKDVGPL